MKSNNVVLWNYRSYKYLRFWICSPFFVIECTKHHHFNLQIMKNIPIIHYFSDQEIKRNESLRCDYICTLLRQSWVHYFIFSQQLASKVFVPFYVILHSVYAIYFTEKNRHFSACLETLGHILAPTGHLFIIMTLQILINLTFTANWGFHQFKKVGKVCVYLKDGFGLDVKSNSPK